MNEYQTIRDRLHALKEWHKTGGVMVLGYDMFRLLASGVRIRYKKWKIEFAELLLDPGACGRKTATDMCGSWLENG